MKTWKQMCFWFGVAAFLGLLLGWCVKVSAEDFNPEVMVGWDVLHQEIAPNGLLVVYLENPKPCEVSHAVLLVHPSKTVIAYYLYRNARLELWGFNGETYIRMELDKDIEEALIKTLRNVIVRKKA